VLAQELPPGGPGSKRRGWRAVAVEDTADGLVGGAKAELEQFALDPPITPARVLAGEVQDERSALSDQTWTSARGAVCE
jgi:hypothetical protein